MTLTKERIEQFKKTPNEENTWAEFVELCDLALIGLAVQPRPIEEADPMLEDQQYYTIIPDQGVFSITWYAGAKAWKTHAISKHEVTFFYDFSTLPTPQVKP